MATVHVPRTCAKCGSPVEIWHGPSAKIARCQTQKAGHVFLIIPSTSAVVRF